MIDWDYLSLYTIIMNCSFECVIFMSSDNKWCVYQVKKRGKRKVIGVLDIYGFEIFKVQTVVFV